MKNFMLLVPRSKDGYRCPDTGVAVNVNSLGFGGTFAVKNEETL